MGPSISLLTLFIILLLTFISFKDYTQGFFLTRYEIYQKSENTSIPQQYSKIVLLLIDALRWDFVYPSNSSKHYNNKLTTLNSLLSSQPNNSVIFTLKSDPPTVTMQRIKALATGSLPTFIDFKDNLQSDKIQEDNLIFQSQKKSKKTLFVGDQIWVFLLPDSFTLAYPYDSHNVRDLDTVDQGVISKFRQHLNESWDLMIGHMLGVDHAAHRYYANHPEMSRKLQEANDFIKEISEKIDDDTLLLVIGDHGMTEEGNHGGATLEETQTVLFGYSKKQLSGFRREKILEQIDIVPTISVLMGIPIPFNSLGSVIPELFKEEKWIRESLFANAKQVSRYLETYDREVKKLPDEDYEKVQSKFMEIERKYSDGNVLTDDIFQFIEEAGKMCRGIWTTFDYVMMVKGMISVILGTVSGVLMLIYTVEDLLYKDIVVIVLLSGVSCSLSFIYIIYKLHKNAVSFNLNKDFKIVLFLNILHGYTLFSDSYIVKQDQAVRFLAQLLIGYSGVSSGSYLHFLCSLCIRLTSLFDIYTQTSESSIFYSSILITNLPLIALFYLRSKLFYRFNLALIFLYWNIPEFNNQLIPKFVYLVFVSSLFINRTKWNILPLLLILSGPQSPILALLCITQIWSGRKIMKSQELFGTFLAFSAWQFFYATGHRCNIQSLRLSSGFIGFDEYIFWVNTTLISFNTLAAYFVVLACRDSKDVKYFMIHFCVSACCTLMNTFINGRHLMVWSVFAPKFIFDGIIFFVVWVFCLALLKKFEGGNRLGKE